MPKNPGGEHGKKENKYLGLTPKKGYILENLPLYVTQLCSPMYILIIYWLSSS